MQFDDNLPSCGVFGFVLRGAGGSPRSVGLVFPPGSATACTIDGPSLPPSTFSALFLALGLPETAFCIPCLSAHRSNLFLLCVPGDLLTLLSHPLLFLKGGAFVF